MTSARAGSRPASSAPPQLRLHLPEPDYTRPLLEMSAAQKERILEKLALLYGKQRAQACFPELERLMRVYYAHKTAEMITEDRAFDPADRFTEKEVILITYGDLLSSPGRSPLRVLFDVLNTFMRPISTVHILPFFPYSSDRGFSVMDYEEVDPRLGTWAEIEELSVHFRLMFDGVFNHVSSKSRWFQSFLNGNPGFEDWFVAFSTKDAIDRDHLRLILRPRTSDLLTPFRTLHGVKFVWTTFGPDQADLNFTNEKVLLRVIEVLLLYVRHGADIIRLDAVTYIWRELGTRCAHLKETHALVQLFRAILDVVAPSVALITETNVPHADNISYFGDGKNEAQMVYNFALPPLVLLAFQTGSCRHLARWASTLEQVSDTATYFNFLDSHDGIGLLGVKDILSEEEISAMVEGVRAHRGLVSYRDNGDGTKSPYELNTTWYSALNREDSGESLDLQVARFVASRSIALVLMGVPGIYLPSIFGSRNDLEAVTAGSEARSINRKAFDVQALYEKLADINSPVHKVAVRFGRLIRRRIGIRAFHPNGRQQVLFESDAVFSVLRAAPDGSQPVLALTNVTAQTQRVSFAEAKLGSGGSGWRDRLSRRKFTPTDGSLEVHLRPYEVLWLSPEAKGT